MTPKEFLDRYHAAGMMAKKISGLDKMIYNLVVEIQADKEKLNRLALNAMKGWQLVIDDPKMYVPICDDEAKYALARFNANFEMFKHLMDYRQTAPASERTV